MSDRAASENKKQVNLRLPVKLVDTIDEVTDNRTQFIIRAAVRFLREEELIEQEIERRKTRKQELRQEKHSLDDEIERERDRIERLRDLRTEMRTLNKVRSQIPDTQIQRIRDTIRQNKYDSTDQKPLSPSSIREHNAERLADEYDLDEEDVLEVLKIETVT